MSISTMDGVQKRLNSEGVMRKCIRGRKHCCTVNTEVLIKDKWYPICSSECLGEVAVKILMGESVGLEKFTEFKL